MRLPLDDGYHQRSLQDAADDDVLSLALCEWFIAIFTATGEGEWNFLYTIETARAYLFTSVLTAPGIRDAFVGFVVRDGEILGAACVTVGPAVAVFSAAEMPTGFTTEAHARTVRFHLDWLAGEGATLAHFRLLGIRHAFRGSVTLLRTLMAGPCERALAAGTTFMAFWTSSKRSTFLRIARTLGWLTVYDFQESQEYLFLGFYADHASRQMRAASHVWRRVLAERRRFSS